MKSKKEIDEIRAVTSWNNYERSAVGVEDFEYTAAQMCLDGTASDEIYNSLEKCYASYNGETFTAVGPNFGPIQITGKNALEAFNRCNL